MSGLHASINIHVSDSFDNHRGEKVHNLTYFKERLGYHEDRIKNLHLLYALVLKSVATIEKTLLA
jgi:Endoplasmic Reticulum Oxidoreductin 1 (ERO1)